MRPRASWLVIPAYVLAAIVTTWPLAREMSHAIPSSRTLVDARFQAFLLGWDWHALTTDPRRIFDPPIFHPEKNGLTSMDHLIGETVVAAPLLAGATSTAPAYDALVLLSFVLSGWATYRLARALGASRAAAGLAGFLFAFGPYRFANLDQLNQLQTQWFPLALWFAWRFVTKSRTRDLAALAATFVAQVYFGWYYAFFLALLLAVFFAWAVLARRVDGRRVRPGAIALALAATAACVLPVTLPYLEHARAAPEFRRAPIEVETGSASALDYLRTHPAAAATARAPLGVGLQAHWPGLVTVVFAAVGIVAIARRRRWRDEGFFVVLALVAFVLSLGPTLHAFGRPTGVPLPYALLYRFVPGFMSLRVPGRLGVLVLLALALLAAFGWDALRRRGLLGASPAGRAAAALVFAVALVTAWQKPTTLVDMPTAATMPPVYAWLAAQPGAPPVVEVPTSFDETDESETDVLRQCYVLFHGKPRLDGASGWVSPAYRRFRVAMRGFPDAAALAAIDTMGGKIVIVHAGDYAPARRADLRARIAAEPRLEPAARFGDDEVFRLYSKERPAAGDSSAETERSAAP
jgi:hypothetical protein